MVGSITNETAETAPNVWRLKTRSLSFETPRLAGVINATPDSFSDGGRFAAAPENAADSRFRVDLNAIVDAARELVRDGAAILDVGGESSRPGAEPIGEAEELRRVVPVVKALVAALDVPISVDAYRPAVADAALEAGAEIVNDVSAGRFVASENRFANENETNFPEETAEVVRRRGAAVVLTHMRGTPKTMQATTPEYPRGVVEQVADFLRRRRDRFVELGVDSARIALDPGVGFGKTFEQNWTLIRRANEIVKLGSPTFYGCSRKRFLVETARRFAARRGGGDGDATLDPTALDLRDDATAATTALLAARGVAIIRVHNVLKSALALEFWKQGSERKR